MAREKKTRAKVLGVTVKWVRNPVQEKRQQVLENALTAIEEAALAALERYMPALDAAGFVHLPTQIELEILRAKPAILHRLEGGDR